MSRKGRGEGERREEESAFLSREKRRRPLIHINMWGENFHIKLFTTNQVVLLVDIKVRLIPHFSRNNFPPCVIRRLHSNSFRSVGHSGLLLIPCVCESVFVSKAMTMKRSSQERKGFSQDRDIRTEEGWMTLLLGEMGQRPLLNRLLPLPFLTTYEISFPLFFCSGPNWLVVTLSFCEIRP